MFFRCLVFKNIFRCCSEVCEWYLDIRILSWRAYIVDRVEFMCRIIFVSFIPSHGIFFLLKISQVYFFKGDSDDCSLIRIYYNGSETYICESVACVGRPSRWTRCCAGRSPRGTLGVHREDWPSICSPSTSFSQYLHWSWSSCKTPRLAQKRETYDHITQNRDQCPILHSISSAIFH